MDVLPLWKIVRNLDRIEFLGALQTAKLRLQERVVKRSVMKSLPLGGSFARWSRAMVRQLQLPGRKRKQSSGMGSPVRGHLGVAHAASNSLRSFKKRELA